MLHDMLFSIATDGAGADTITGEASVLGFVRKVEWVDGTLADGVDAILSQTSTASGIDETILTLTNADNDLCYYPKVTAVTAAWCTGTADYPILNGTPKLVVSSGGATRLGALILYWTDEL